jgi:hypothetical protein
VLDGAGRDRTILDPQSATPGGPTIDIKTTAAGDVTLKGFTIRNGGNPGQYNIHAQGTVPGPVRQRRDRGQDANNAKGLFVTGAANLEVRNSLITNTFVYGIQVVNHTGSTDIHDNVIGPLSWTTGTAPARAPTGASPARWCAAIG